MLMFKEKRPAIRTLRGWAISVLQEAGAIRECEEHCWIQDCADPHARECALTIAREGLRSNACGVRYPARARKSFSCKEQVLLPRQPKRSLKRMLAKIDDLCVQRDELRKNQPGPTKGKVLGGRRW
jgi:hypothetical protein